MGPVFESGDACDVEQVNRIMALINWLHELLQFAATHGRGEEVESITRMGPKALKADARRYSSFLGRQYKSTEFYIMDVHTPYNLRGMTDWDNVIIPDGPTELLIQGAKVYNNCRFSALVGHNLLSRLFANDVYIQSVEWAACMPKPRFVIFRRVNGEQDVVEETSSHDVLRLTAKNGQRYIVDLSGAQFGFDNWFYTEQDYMWNCVYKRRGVHPRLPFEQLDEFRESARSKDRDERQHGKDSLHLRQIAIWAFDSVQKRKSRKHGLPTMTLQQLSDEERNKAFGEIVELFKAAMREFMALNIF